MTKFLLGLFILTIVFGCSNPTPPPDASDEVVARLAPGPDAEADCFDEACIEPWVDEPEYDPNTFDPEAQDTAPVPETTTSTTTEIVAPAPIDAGVPSDGGCVGQTEPQCPPAPPGTRPQNPGIPSGGLCRGACGKACPSSCVPGPTETTCIEWQDASCQWHQKTCTYETIECGTAQGCEDHDNCYDTCKPGWRGIACRRSCDAACVKKWGVKKCNSWRQGKGPFDPNWLRFAGPATSGPVYDTTCY